MVSSSKRVPLPPTPSHVPREGETGRERRTHVPREGEMGRERRSHLPPEGEAIGSARVFAHPLFVIALVVLVLNDHVLKGSGIVPGVITGKLSDVAGLMVAPAVLAWVMRVKSARGWLACHAAIGIVFAALELSPALAEACSVGPFRMWADPYDLLALPALAISYFVLRAARSKRPHHLIGAIALIACTATSRSDPAVRYPYRPGGSIETDAYVRHTGTEDLVLHVRRLRDEVTVDCDGLLDVPEQMVEDGDFMDEQHWTLTRGDALPLWDRFHDAPERECYAVRVNNGSVTWLLTWRHGAPPVREVPLRTEEVQTPEEGAIVFRTGDHEPRVPAGVSVRRR
jgi:hypothetical protein